MFRKNKGFSMVEVMVASALSLSLGIVVATTLNTATNSMRKSNYRINANSNARNLSTNLNKFISSAEKRSYCVDTKDAQGVTTSCAYMDKDKNYAPILYFGPGQNGVDYQLEFFSNICLKTLATCATSSSRVNAAKVIIYVKKDAVPASPTATQTAEIGICYIPNTAALYTLSTMTSATVSTGTNCPAANMVYRSNNVKYSSSLFKLIDSSGSTPACANPAQSPLNTSPDQTCLGTIKSLRVVADVLWLNDPKNKAAMGSNKTTIDNFISIKGSN